MIFLSQNYVKTHVLVILQLTLHTLGLDALEMRANCMTVIEKTITDVVMQLVYIVVSVLAYISNLQILTSESHAELFKG